MGSAHVSSPSPKFVPLSPNPGDYFRSIDELAVTASYRRKGVGEQMLARIYEWFDAKNIDRIHVGLDAGIQVAYSFWKKHGFNDFSYRLYLDRKK